MIKQYFWVYGMRMWLNWPNGTDLPTVAWAMSNCLWAWVEQKQRKVELISLPELRTLLYLYLGYHNSRFSVSQSLELASVSSLHSQPLTSSWELHCQLPLRPCSGGLSHITRTQESTACRWPLIGLLSSYNHVRQFAELPLIYLYMV
jgi:hypothetical protein